jgi:hypothetical protein
MFNCMYSTKKIPAKKWQKLAYPGFQVRVSPTLSSRKFPSWEHELEPFLPRVEESFQ